MIDSHKKSFIKSLIWRILGIVILATVTYYYTRHWLQTGLITFIHHASFIVIFYLHERAWVKVRWRLRHILKAITYEIILGNLVLGTITWLITGDWKKVTGITLTYITIKLIMYPIYDYLWSKRTVYAYVVGDPLHVGHLEHLMNCRKHGNYVIVGILTDEATMEKKPRPTLPLEQRMDMVRAIRHVDEVVPQYTYSPLINVINIKPDVLMETTDHSEMPANDYVKSYGGKVVITQVPNSKERRQSSTKIKQKICQDYS